jgi:hypothetical protein
MDPSFQDSGKGRVRAILQLQTLRTAALCCCLARALEGWSVVYPEHLQKILNFEAVVAQTNSGGRIGERTAIAIGRHCLFASLAVQEVRIPSIYAGHWIIS